MSEEQSLRMAAEIVDKWSGPLKEMQKSLRRMRDELHGKRVWGSIADRLPEYEAPNRRRFPSEMLGGLWGGLAVGACAGLLRLR